MRANLATTMLLLATASVAAEDIYDAVFVSNKAACDRAAEAEFGQVLFDLQATVLIPRHGIWSGGELVCTMRNLDTDVSPIADTPADLELYGTARCHGYDLDFIDQVVVSGFAQGINAENGDDGVDHPPGEKVQLYSMRADLRAPDVPDYDKYAGIYTRCDGLTLEDVAWPE